MKTIFSIRDIRDFINNLVESISAFLELTIATYKPGLGASPKTKRATEMYRKMPYLLGIDLVNNSNLKVNGYKLNALDKFINVIRDDAITTSKLKSAMNELERADLEWAKHRAISSPEEFKAQQSYYDLLNRVIAEIVVDVLEGPKYSSLSNQVSQLLQSGLSGISDEDMISVKEKYFIVVNKRIVDYVDEYIVFHELTPSELEEYSKLTNGDYASGTKPFGWRRAKIEKQQFPHCLFEE